jgi:hypothetical protein
MPFGGLVVNRVQLDVLDGDPDEAAAALDGDIDDALREKVAETLRELRVLADRDRASLTHLMTELDDRDPIVVPLLDGDVHDVDGLAQVHHHLFARAD